MPTLSDVETPFVKIMLIGDSGAGKTGSLASLVEAGYQLRVVDMDDGLSPLAHILREKDKALLSRVQYVSYRDTYLPTPQGMRLKMPAMAYLNAAKTMNQWEDGSSPASWGPDYVYVVDSLTMLAKAAFNQAVTLAPNTKDPRQWYGAAQNAVENYLSALMGPDFKTNVIVISHIQEIELTDGSVKGFPAAVGRALSRHIAKHLNDLFVCETQGQGNAVKRIIRTTPNGMVDAKSAARGLPSTLPLETGLATIFAALSGRDKV